MVIVPWSWTWWWHFLSDACHLHSGCALVFYSTCPMLHSSLTNAFPIQAANFVSSRQWMYYLGREIAIWTYLTTCFMDCREYFKSAAYRKGDKRAFVLYFLMCDILVKCQNLYMHTNTTEARKAFKCACMCVCARAQLFFSYPCLVTKTLKFHIFWYVVAFMLILCWCLLHMIFLFFFFAFDVKLCP